VIPDTHDNTDIVVAKRGPAHGEKHYIPGDGFLISNGGFSEESKARVYDRRKKEIRSLQPGGNRKDINDSGTYLSEDEILNLADVINQHRAMTGAKGRKTAAFDRARAECHPGTDAVDSAKDGIHRQSDDFDIDKSRSSIHIGICTVGPPGAALNGSKVYHRSVVSLRITSPDGRCICEVDMSPEQFATALVGNADTPCTLRSYWSLIDESVLLTERVRRPESIRKRMEKRLKHRLGEQADALRKIAEEMEERAETGKAAGKTLQREWAERVARATEHSASNAAFTVEQAREEITGIMESAAIQFISQQNLDPKTLYDAAGPALEMGDEAPLLPGPKP
jgi:hypothetical protein